MGMFENENGTLNGIEVGRHFLALRVVVDDHKPSRTPLIESSFK